MCCYLLFPIFGPVGNYFPQQTNSGIWGDWYKVMCHGWEEVQLWLWVKCRRQSHAATLAPHSNLVFVEQQLCHDGPPQEEEMMRCRISIKSSGLQGIGFIMKSFAPALINASRCDFFHFYKTLIAPANFSNNILWNTPQHPRGCQSDVLPSHWQRFGHHLGCRGGSATVECHGAPHRLQHS